MKKDVEAISDSLDPGILLYPRSAFDFIPLAPIFIPALAILFFFLDSIELPIFVQIFGSDIPTINDRNFIFFFSILITIQLAVPLISEIHRIKKLSSNLHAINFINVGLFFAIIAIFLSPFYQIVLNRIFDLIIYAINIVAPYFFIINNLFFLAFFLMIALATWRGYRVWQSDRTQIKKHTASFTANRAAISEAFKSLAMPSSRIRYVQWLEDQYQEEPHGKALANWADNAWPEGGPPNVENDEASWRLAELERIWIGLNR